MWPILVLEPGVSVVVCLGFNRLCGALLGCRKTGRRPKKRHNKLEIQHLNQGYAVCRSVHILRHCTTLLTTCAWVA